MSPSNWTGGLMAAIGIMKPAAKMAAVEIMGAALKIQFVVTL